MHFNQDFIQFFKDLAGQNHKDWFDENRKRYHTSVKEPFENFIADLIVALQKVDPTIQPNPKDCIFRINRDVRFSKDKTPYKTDRSAILSKHGRKDKEYPGFYVRLSPDTCEIGGGAYFLQKENLLFLREKISQNSTKWNKLISDKQFLGVYPKGVQGERNKMVPREFKGSPLTSDYILNKQFYYMSSHPSDIILRDDLIDYCVEKFTASLKVKNFMADVFES